MIAVSTAIRSRGAVSMVDMSRTPARDSCRVRGTGVAVIARTWTLFFNFFNLSF